MPKNPPGLKFWEGNEAAAVCAQGNAQCIVTYEKGLFGNQKCTGNCECLDKKWEQDKANVCMNLGDCGPNVNWVGAVGYKPGFKVTIGKVKAAKKWIWIINCLVRELLESNETSQSITF